ncbi:MAG: hypothetical protein ACLGH0_10525, partial [Thermoanaerobaculia bacterium]
TIGRAESPSLQKAAAPCTDAPCRKVLRQPSVAHPMGYGTEFVYQFPQDWPIERYLHIILLNTGQVGNIQITDSNAAGAIGAATGTPTGLTGARMSYERDDGTYTVELSWTPYSYEVTAVLQRDSPEAE